MVYELCVRHGSLAGSVEVKNHYIYECCVVGLFFGLPAHR